MDAAPQFHSHLHHRAHAAARVASAIGLLATVALALPARLRAEPGFVTLVSGTKLAGLLALDDERIEGWPEATRWIFPVGNPDSLGRGSDEPGYRVNRGIGPATPTATAHQGVDLCNRRAGGVVSAAALGIVVFAGERESNGFGVHVVMGHRLEDGSLVYTVYAHLARGSLEVAAGQVIEAGQPLGRVGRTGRASTDHLHLETRVPANPEQRWEKAAFIDPLAFIAARRVVPAAAAVDGDAR